MPPNKLIPIGTVCWWQRDKSKKPIKVTIVEHVDLYGAFLHYMGTKHDRPENERYAFYHDDLQIIDLPKE